MAETFNGIGSSYWGHWYIDVNDRLLHVQTEWFVFCWVPLIPVRSVVLISEGHKKFTGVPPFYWKASQSRNQVQTRLFWPQVFLIYSGWSTAFAAMTAFGLSAPDISFGLIDIVPMIAWLLCLCIFPFLTLRSASRMMKIRTLLKDYPWAYSQGKFRPALLEPIEWAILIRPIIGRLFSRRSSLVLDRLFATYKKMAVREYQRHTILPLVNLVCVLLAFLVLLFKSV